MATVGVEHPVFESFTASTKRKQAKAVLARRASNRVLEDLQGQDRVSARTAMLAMEIVIPKAGRHWQYDEAFPVLLTDISAGGVGLVFHEPIRGELLLRLTDNLGVHYLQFTIQYCSELGFGYWQMGLECQKLERPSDGDEAVLNDRIAIFEEYSAQQRAAHEAE